MEGSALCSEACDKADEAKYLRGHSYQQLIADGYSPEELARAGRRP